MPPGFSFPGMRAELFLVLRLQRDSSRGGRSFVTVARLREGVPLARAQTEMSAIAARLAAEDPAYNAKWGATVVRLQDHATGSVRPVLLVLLGAVFCVLLIACANIACLLAMRAGERAREMNVRVALGAPRWRLVHQLAVECLVLAGAGGALGLLIAHAGVPAILSLFPASFPLPRAQEVAVDARVLAVTAALSIGVGLVLGILPAWQAGRGRMAELLRAGGRALTGGARTRSALVVVEVTLAVVLVIGAGLLAAASRTCRQPIRVSSPSACSPRRCCSSPRATRTRRAARRWWSRSSSAYGRCRACARPVRSISFRSAGSTPAPARTGSTVPCRPTARIPARGSR
jgi:hypothetical protein